MSPRRFAWVIQGAWLGSVRQCTSCSEPALDAGGDVRQGVMLGLCALIHVASGVLVFGSRSWGWLGSSKSPDLSRWWQSLRLEPLDPRAYSDLSGSALRPGSLFDPLPVVCVLEVGLLSVADFYIVASHLTSGRSEILYSSAMDSDGVGILEIGCDMLDSFLLGLLIPQPNAVAQTMRPIRSSV